MIIPNRLTPQRPFDQLAFTSGAAIRCTAPLDGFADMPFTSSRMLLATSTIALALSPLASGIAAAQYSGSANDAPPATYSNDPAPDRYAQATRDDRAPQAYDDRGPQGYDDRAPQDYAGAPQSDLPPPPGYDGTRPPPPPPGYQSGPADEVQRDSRYAANVESWSQQNCVKAHNNTATGAVIGGVLGALLGNGLAGRHDRGAGTFAGAAVGAVGGAAIGNSSSNDTSPGCPPGFVVRRDAQVYTYAEPDYAYAAPGWYQPWVFVGGGWSYRPYPYHAWYYRTYRPYYGHYGYYGRPGYGRGPGRGYYRR
jgi:hypothetical protein